MSRTFFVYILTNYANTVFYTGITNNLERRTLEHNQGLHTNSFSKKYRLYKLIWYEQFSNPKGAIAAEKQVKDWRREKKLKLIKKLNPSLKDLFTLR